MRFSYYTKAKYGSKWYRRRIKRSAIKGTYSMLMNLLFPPMYEFTPELWVAGDANEMLEAKIHYGKLLSNEATCSETKLTPEILDRAFKALETNHE